MTDTTDFFDSYSTEDQLELLKRMMTCYADLQLSLSALTFLNEVEENETYSIVELRRFKCYEMAFVVSYGRAFTKSFGNKFRLIDFEQIGIKLSEQQQAHHDAILSSRHGKYAHSDMSHSHIRLDLYDVGDHKFSYKIARVKWDEGLDFIEGFLPYELMDLVHYIMSAINKTINLLSIELETHLPIYVRPYTEEGN